MGGNNNTEHTRLCTEIQLSLGAHPNIKAFKNNQGLAYLKTAAGMVPYRYGLGPGTSDLIVCCSKIVDQSWVGKRALLFGAVEVKTGTGRPDASQKSFIDMVLTLGGVAGVARSVEDAWKIVSG